MLPDFIEQHFWKISFQRSSDGLYLQNVYSCTLNKQPLNAPVASLEIDPPQFLQTSSNTCTFKIWKSSRQKKNFENYAIF